MATSEGEQFRAAVEKLFDLFLRELEEHFESDAELVRTADLDALMQKHAGVLNRAFDRTIARLEKTDPEIAEGLRAELLPLRELMRKRIVDMLRPH